MTDKELQEALAEMRDYIEHDVAAGFRSEQEIRERVVDMLADNYDATELRSHADTLTRELIDGHLQRQASWPAKTDCDRLDAAFNELEQAGVVARQDFSCCGTCGAAEIWDEMETEGRSGRDVRGYTFYHVQDTERAIEGEGVCLNYGAVEEGESAALDIAAEIVAALQRHGLKVEWDGTWQKRILVHMDWKRRRHTVS